MAVAMMRRERRNQKSLRGRQVVIEGAWIVGRGSALNTNYQSNENRNKTARKCTFVFLRRLANIHVFHLFADLVRRLAISAVHTTRLSDADYLQWKTVVVG